MLCPVGSADLLGDQRLGGVVVGDAQQRFAEAHECDAFFVRKAELGEEEIQHRTFV